MDTFFGTMPRRPDGTEGSLKNLLEQNAAVQSCLNGLDREYGMLGNWRHLADRLEAPPEVKKDCNSVTKHSPTLHILKLPNISIKTCKEFMDIFVDGAGQRKDVYDALKDGIPEDERELSIEKAFLSKEELTDDVARMLDAKPLSNATKNWKYYGKKLGIPDANLDLIERDGKNPAKELLLYVYHAIDKEKKTAGVFRKIIMDFKDRPDLHNLVNKDLNIKENDSRPLKEILPPDSEEMAKATFLLNDCNKTKSDWKQLAQGWGVSYEIYEQFDYELCPGPTQKLMEWVCTSNHQVSVQNLLDMLGGIKRNDIKEKLENIISKQINSPSSSRTTGNSM